MDAARGCGLSLLLAALVLACSSGPKAPTQLVVNADADAEVATRIRRVRALLYDTQETDVEKPSHQQAFTVVSGEPTEDQVKLPFSFGVVAGRANRAVLVIRGYTTLAANARPGDRAQANRRVQNGQEHPSAGRAR